MTIFLPIFEALGAAFNIFNGVGRLIRHWLIGSSTSVPPIIIQIYVSADSSRLKPDNVAVAVADQDELTSIVESGAVTEVEVQTNSVARILYDNDPERMQYLADRYPSDTDLGYHAIQYTIQSAPHLLERIAGSMFLTDIIDEKPKIKLVSQVIVEAMRPVSTAARMKKYLTEVETES